MFSVHAVWERLKAYYSGNTHRIYRLCVSVTIAVQIICIVILSSALTRGDVL